MDAPILKNTEGNNSAGVFQGVTMDFRKMYADSKEIRLGVAKIQHRMEKDSLPDIDLIKICQEQFYLPQDKTMFEQPAIFAVSMARMAALNEEVDIHTFVGHSLGEYAALWAGGVFSAEDGFRITKKRGQLVRDVNVKFPGLMAAISGTIDLDEIRGFCEQQEVDIANVNSPEQIVISGDRAGVQRVCGMLENIKGLRVTQLETGGAFHSRRLEPVKDEFREFLETVPFNEPFVKGKKNVKIFMNSTARPETDPDTIKDCLTNQLSSPVDFPSTIKSLDEAGVDNIYEVGHGNILTNFIKRILRRRP